MPRPVKPRRVENMPQVNYFKPVGIPMVKLKEIILSVDEFEALRLKDMEKFDQQVCAEKMGVAQSTFQRIITIARNKVVTSLVEGKALRIEGGNINLPDSYICHKCKRRWLDNKKEVKTKPQSQVVNREKSCPECGKIK